jgi:flagellar motor protein MotB
MISQALNAQIINPREVAKEKATQRTNSRIDQGIDRGMDKMEEGVGKLFKKKGTKEVEGEEEEAEEAEEAVEQENGDGEGEEETAPKATSSQPEKTKLQSTTQYDFVPGDKILFFEDFSQDAVGDFPALWTTNGSAEVKTVNVAPGKWFHMNGEDAVYCYTKEIAFPDNFIVEFDIIPDEAYDRGIVFTLYQENPEDPKELNDDLYPGKGGVHIVPTAEGWETLGYTDSPDDSWITGEATKNPVVKEQVNHLILWIQKRRVRIYHEGAKVIDLPTNIYPGIVFNKIRFSGWDRGSWPMVTNLKITTAAPDTRSKLITEGKLVTYGITFDVNKADIKPESQGTLKSIADVLKENPGVRIKIVGHTDSDGDDKLNQQLSQRRAEAVKTALATTYGIDASLLETEGAGETKPVAANDTPENKAKNRRVELIKL